MSRKGDKPAPTGTWGAEEFAFRAIVTIDPQITAFPTSPCGLHYRLSRLQL